MRRSESPNLPLRRNDGGSCSRLVPVPVMHVRKVRMGVLERLVYMNVRVRFLIMHAMRVPMSMMLIVGVPVFMLNGRMPVQMCVILGDM